MDVYKRCIKFEIPDILESIIEKRHQSEDFQENIRDYCQCMEEDNTMIARCIHCHVKLHITCLIKYLTVSESMEHWGCVKCCK